MSLQNPFSAWVKCKICLGYVAVGPLGRLTVSDHYWATAIEVMESLNIMTCSESYCCDQQTLSSSLNCRFLRSGRVPYEQYKMEFLHSSPDVVIFLDFVTDREASTLRDMAGSKVTHQAVSHDHNSVCL